MQPNTGGRGNDWLSASPQTFSFNYTVQSAEFTLCWPLQLTIALEKKSPYLSLQKLRAMAATYLATGTTHVLTLQLTLSPF